MKRIVAFTMVVVMLLLACVSLSSCGRRNNSIDFGKKYIPEFLNNETFYYVFRANGTGYMECDYVAFKGDSYCEHTCSGRIDFEWREAADGAVYLFEVERTYNENHTDGKDLPFVKSGIYFGKGFFVSTSSSMYGDTLRYYIMEGSKLDEALKDKA
jgi:hypothetical protein